MQVSVFRFNDYRLYLRAVLAERSKKNRGYSLRAMARALGLSASVLSDIHNGKKNLSSNKAYLTAQKLDLKAKERDYFCTLVELGRSKEPESSAQILDRLDRMNPGRKVTAIEIDKFSLISEWYYLPILAMVDLSDFVLTPENVSSRLGITALQARTAIEKLLRIGFLKWEKGKYVRSFVNGEFHSPGYHRGLRSFHRQMFHRSIESLYRQAPQERVIGTETFAVDPKILPEIEMLYQQFVQELQRLLDSPEKKSEVYHLSFHCFRLTHGSSPGGNSALH